jgi:hypothetical protein
MGGLKNGVLQVGWVTGAAGLSIVVHQRCAGYDMHFMDDV